MKIKKQTLKLVALVIVAVLVVGILTYISTRPPSKDYSEFAQCLSDSGATMYGTYWCSHCNAQKADFGEAFKFINYVECSDEAELCTEKGVEAFPSWIIDDKIYRGKQSFEKLSELTGCELN